MPLHATFSSFGQPENVIKLIDTPSPDLQPGDIRLRMLASPINPADINFIQGIYGITPKLPATPGFEGCGEVIESQSNKFDTGDRVICVKYVGTWAEEITCHADTVLRISDNIPADQAAMLKINPLTAWCMLTQFKRLEKKSWVIQNAANSGVGTCVIQVAKLLGLRTINLVRREEPIRTLLKLGADHVLPDDKKSIARVKKITANAPPSLALNAVGGDSALRLMDALSIRGIHVTYGAMSRRSLKVPNKFLIFKRIRLHGFWVSEWIKEQEPDFVRKTYKQLDKWSTEENLTQPIDSTYALRNIQAALTRATQNKRNGKVIISMTK